MTTEKTALATRREATLEVVEADILEGRNLYYDLPSYINACEKLRKKYTIYSPVNRIPMIPRGFAIAINPVAISTNPDDGTDWYKAEGGYSLRKHALGRIAGAANVSWDPRLTRQTDDGKDPNRVAFTAYGEYLSFDSSKRGIMGSAIEDLRDGSAQVEEIIANAEKSKRDWRPQLRRERINIYEVAETRAKLRALRDAYAIPIVYSLEEARRPIMIPALQFTGRYPDNPELEERVAEARAMAYVNAERAIYGPKAPNLEEIAHLAQEGQSAGAVVGAVEDKSQEAEEPKKEEEDIPF